ncbi:recombinase family protein [Lysobacter sp. Hz 25]|uniref:recombinase family protein n=1 Tax=Lysobacter sp. Hz 25 TaxID=3383698 RepID=UPI0038D3A6DD
MSAIQEPLRIAIYCHTILKDRDEIGFQRKVIKRTLDRCTDLPPVLTFYTDDGFCPDTQVRPEFQRMLLDAAAGHLDCVAVCGWDRLTTITDDRSLLKRFLDRHDVHVLECKVLEAVLIRMAA